MRRVSDRSFLLGHPVQKYLFRTVKRINAFLDCQYYFILQINNNSKHFRIVLKNINYNTKLDKIYGIRFQNLLSIETLQK